MATLEDESGAFDFHSNLATCFAKFDKNKDGKLDEKEFQTLCRALFRNHEGKSYETEEEKLKVLFGVYDQNGDEFIDKKEFEFCWNRWIKIVCNPISALLIVDVQNDFISGTLSIGNCPAKQNGLEVLDPINKLLETVKFTGVFYSLDWHPENHVSFIDNVQLRKIDPSSPITAEKAQVYDTVTFPGSPTMQQKLWPKHCVQNTWGSELHKDLKIAKDAIKIYKGANPEVDSYSAFWDNKKLTDTGLNAQLHEKNVTDIYVCGLAYDVCVGSSALDALTMGYRTILLDDCCRGLDLDDIAKTKKFIIESHGIVANSNQVKAMVEGRDRRPELGHKLGIELKIKKT